MDFYKLWEQANLFKIENNQYKHKKYIYTPYLKAKDDGFNDGGFRNYLYADSISRFYRLKNDNVFFSIGANYLAYQAFYYAKIKSNSLNSNNLINYEDELKSLDVGFLNSKLLNNRSNEALLILEKLFLYYFNHGLIKEDKIEVTISHHKDKIYDTFLKKPGEIINKECLVLDTTNHIEKIIENIDKLNIENEYKDKLKEAFKETYYLDVLFTLKNGSSFSLLFDHPEYMAGIFAIVINPNMVDVFDFIQPEEIFLIERFLESNKKGFLFTGSYVNNPLTGNKIPLFISFNYEEAFKELNIINDIILLDELGLEHFKIINNNLMINSDFLDGLTVKEAHQKIIEVFSSEGLGEIKKVYLKTKFLLTQLEEYGMPVPLLKGDGLYALDNNLPITFSSQFRVEIPNINDIPSNFKPFKCSLNSFFSDGLEPLLNILLVEGTNYNDILSNSNLIVLKSWLKKSLFIIDPDNIYNELLNIIILTSIIEDVSEVKLLDNIEVIFVKKVKDSFGNDIKIEYNNCIKTSNIIKSYGKDALRLYYLSKNKNEYLYFNKDHIYQFKQMLLSIRGIYERGFKETNFSLEYPFYYFKNMVFEGLIQLDLSKVVKAILDFYHNFLTKEVMSKKQALDFLSVLNLVCPNFAEELNYDYFSKKQLISNREFSF